MTIVWNGLAPHPPIIVPAVGGARCAEVRKTIESMRALARDLIAARPDRLILISPHTPRPYRGIAAWTSGSVRGSFANFGAPGARCELPVDAAWIEVFRAGYGAVTDLAGEPLDHGALVPLHFVVEAGWQGATAVLGLSRSEARDGEDIGSAIAAASADDTRTALLASGDMSHCLKPGAPCGYDPRGSQFDERFVERIRALAYRDATQWDPELREAAREDVVTSCHVSWVATNWSDAGHRFASYEGPFGVGYTVMKFYGEAG